MYRKYFGLKEKPFELSPDPRFLYLSEAHKEAFAHLRYGVKEKKGFVVITGEIGTGKTTLLNALIEKLSPSIKRIYLTDPGLTTGDLFYLIGKALNLTDFNGNKGRFLWSLNEYFREKLLTEDDLVLLIIDESQNLSPDMLEEVRLLSNLETSKRRLFQIFLVGQQELNIKLQNPRLRQLRQRIALKYNLTPLNYDDVAQYIRHRLSVAGYTEAKAIFRKNAIKHIYKYTQGYPRLINIVCDQALLTAYTRNETVKKSIIKEVIRDMENSYAKPRWSWNKQIRKQAGWAVLCILACFTLITAGYHFFWKTTISSITGTARREESSLNQKSVHIQGPSSEKAEGKNSVTSALRKAMHQISPPDEKPTIKQETETINAVPQVLAPAKVVDKKEKTIKRVIYFRYNDWHLQDSAITVLSKLTETLVHLDILYNPRKPYSVLVEGHSDPSGSKLANLIVSKGRASVVADWLIQNGGVKPECLIIKAWGSSKPFTEALSQRGGRRDRRAEITINWEDKEPDTVN